MRNRIALVLPVSPFACFRVFCVFLAAGAVAWLCWVCARDPTIPFLPPGPGAWIVFPSPCQGTAHAVRPSFAVFERRFNLAARPARAVLSWRDFRQSRISINGVALLAPARPSSNWKNTARLEVARFLRPGVNTISAAVANDRGFPALTLRLQADGWELQSDGGWEVSLAGSLPRPARLASDTPKPGVGTGLYGLEETGTALGQCWPWLCLLLLAAAALVAVVEYGLRRTTAAAQVRWAGAFLLLAAGLWVLLFLHNAPLLPSNIGFDTDAHLDYVAYVQQHRSLPPPGAGWEMFQAPLYYVLSAALLEGCHLTVAQPQGLFALRLFNLVVGAANVALIFASLRLLFPGEWKKPAAGALLAAFLPAQVYLLHYTTNETLSAALVSAAFYCGLRILRAERPSTGWHAALGVTLGLALLSKLTALVFLPVFFAVLAGKLMAQRQAAVSVWCRTVGLAALLLLLLAGWRYGMMWRDFGSPVAGNWDARVHQPWWQLPGCHTTRYYLSFGDALTAPLFSGFHSFWDSLYSTLWGDGLCGGRNTTASLVPWNYDFMDAGFLLALLPSALVLTGLVCSGVRCWRRLELDSLLLVGAAGLVAFSILFMSLKLPFYSQAKSFYGLSALLPFCVFGLLGLEFWVRRGRALRSLLAVALLLWLFNVYASFWIRPHSLQTQLSQAVGQFEFGPDKRQSAAGFANVLLQDPGNETALTLLADLEARDGQAAAAARHLQNGLRQNPRGALIAHYLAVWFLDQGQTNRALGLAQRAFVLAPENGECAKSLSSLEFHLGDYQKALETGRAALGLEPFDAQVHFTVACAWDKLHRPDQAVPQFETALGLALPSPLEAQAHFYLGQLLAANSARRSEALSHFREAVRLDPQNAAWRDALDKMRNSGAAP